MISNLRSMLVGTALLLIPATAGATTNGLRQVWPSHRQSMEDKMVALENLASVQHAFDRIHAAPGTAASMVVRFVRTLETVPR